MRAVALFIALTLAGCERQPQVIFADAAIALPEDPVELPPGPGREAVLENCTACHSPSTMLQQPRISRAKWEAIAEKMITIYKAPVDPGIIPKIAEYMVAVQTAEAAQPAGAPAPNGKGPRRDGDCGLQSDKRPRAGLCEKAEGR